MKTLWKGLAAAAVMLCASVPAFAQSWKTDPAVQKLYEAAKAEGTVTVWGTAAIEVDWMHEGLAKVFPGIDVKVLGDNDIAAKAIAESRGGKNSVDVFLTSYSAGRALLERKMFGKSDAWKSFGIIPDNVVFDGQAALTHNLLYSVVYNSKLVKAEDAPKQWTDLLDPKYKDKMISSTFLLPRMIGALGLLWGEDKATQFAHDIVDKTGILLTRAPPENFLQSGERVYAVGNFESQSRFWAKQGLPVAFSIPQPVVAGQFYAAVMDKAPHPNAARLIAAYLASAEGKKQAEDYNNEADYRPGADNPIAKQLQASNTPIIWDKMEEMDKRDALIAKMNPIILGQAK